MTGHVKVGGAWKSVASLHGKIAGAWSEVQDGYTKVSGAWEQFYSATVPGDFELIETHILGSSQASVTFSNLGDYSSTYKHLQIRAVVRSNRADTDTRVRLQFNAKTAANYFSHELRADGSSVISGNILSVSSMLIGRVNASTAAANAFGALVLDVLDPYSTSKNKTFRSFCGNQGLNRIGLYSGSLAETPAVTEIKIIDEFASFVAGSRFSIYGIRG
jgi:hypothetical protein